MKAKMKNFTPAIVLGIICLIVAALLAVINIFTAPEIERAELEARTTSLRAVFGGEESGAAFDSPLSFSDAEKERLFGADSYVDEIYREKNGKGFAVILTVPKGFEGSITLTVGVDMDGKITGVEITQYNDSLGKDAMKAAVAGFKGQGSAEDVALVSGATYSSNAVRAAVDQALSAAKAVKSIGDPKVESLSAVFGGDAKIGNALSNAPKIDGSYVTEVYKETKNGGYAIVLSATDDAFGSLELTVGLNKDGKVAGVIVINATGDKDALNEAVKAFADKDSASANSVELLPESAALSGALKKAVSDAFEMVNAIKAEERAFDALISSVLTNGSSEMLGFGKSSLARVEKGSYVSALYEEDTGKGYAVIITVKDGDSEKLGLVIGVGYDLKVKGITLTKYGYQSGEEEISSALVGFVGADSPDAVTLPDTPAAADVRKAVADALSAVKNTEAAKVRRLDEEKIFSIAKQMLEGAEGFKLLTKTEAAPTEGLKEDYKAFKATVYKETSGKGYAVYGETFNEWTYSYGKIESNFVFTLDNDFRVTGFDIIGWSLSDGYNDELAYVEHPAVKKLEASFVGTNITDYTTKVDLVTSATVTSVRMERAVISAFEYLNENHASRVTMYKVIGICAFVAGIAAIGVGIYFQRRRRK